jgi:serine/threonine-protein kinase RsbW
VAESECSACVELRFPCRPEFVGVARLAILGVASRMRFSYDEVEDIRLAVGEACTTSVEWAERNGRSESEILLRSEIGQDKLVVDVYDQAGERGDEGRAGEADQESENLGALLITLLVDEVTVVPDGGGTHVRMVKHAGRR